MADFDIFNLSVDAVDTHEVQSTGSGNDIYKPTADEGKDGTYKALIRFGTQTLLLDFCTEWDLMRLLFFSFFVPPEKFGDQRANFL
jgi:hypothetical protein